MEITKRKRVSLALNITPLIDIVFLLLIFFMLTSTFIREHALDIALPQSDIAQATEDDAIRIEIMASGEYRFHGTIVSGAVIKETLSHEKPTSNVLLMIDNKADVQQLIAVMDIVKNAGLTHIAIAAQASEISEKT